MISFMTLYMCQVLHVVDFLGSRRMETAPTSIEVLLRPTQSQSDEPIDLRGSLSPTSVYSTWQFGRDVANYSDQTQTVERTPYSVYNDWQCIVQPATAYHQDPIDFQLWRRDATHNSGTPCPLTYFRSKNIVYKPHKTIPSPPPQASNLVCKPTHRSSSYLFIWDS